MESGESYSDKLWRIAQRELMPRGGASFFFDHAKLTELISMMNHGQLDLAEMMHIKHMERYRNLPIDPS